MNPKKASQLSKDVAKDLEIDHAVVEAALAFYWKSIRHKIVGLEEPNITVTGIGIFSIRTLKATQRLKDLETILAARNTSTFNRASAYDALAVRVNKIKSILEYLAKERERKLQIKNERLRKQSDKDLEGKE